MAQQGSGYVVTGHQNFWLRNFAIFEQVFDFVRDRTRLSMEIRVRKPLWKQTVNLRKQALMSFVNG